VRCAQLAAEYPAIRFLESNGYDVHYCAGADLWSPVRAGGLFRRTRAYLSVGHDEYWSYPQRAHVEAARDAGVHLSFWSANEAYWAVRFEPSVTAGGIEGAADAADEAADGADGADGADDAREDAPRTMVVYKETQSSAKLDPMPGEWTGTFRDDRDINPKGGMPENALSGHLFAVNAQRNDALVVDGGRFGQHRAWRHTAVASMAPGDPPLVLYPGILGHEWDHDVDNGWRPAALQTLSETTVDNVQTLRDWGAVFDSGTATHSLVLHRRGNGTGAFVFGAATVQWAWALDPVHDVNDPQRQNKYAIRLATDPRGGCAEVRQLTVNVLTGMMGLAPATLQPPLTLPEPSSDRNPPDGGVDERAMDEGGVVTAAGWATDSGGGVVASVEVSWDGERYHPARLEALVAKARWTFVWGDEPWQRLHGAPPDAAVQRTKKLFLRIADDSGNQRVLEDA
jgi:hypothetical protein